MSTLKETADMLIRDFVKELVAMKLAINNEEIPAAMKPNIKLMFDCIKTYNSLKEDQTEKATVADPSAKHKSDSKSYDTESSDEENILASPEEEEEKLNYDSDYDEEPHNGDDVVAEVLNLSMKKMYETIHARHVFSERTT